MKRWVIILIVIAAITGYFGYQIFQDSLPRNRFINDAKSIGVSVEESTRIYDIVNRAVASNKQITSSKDDIVSGTIKTILDLNLVNKNPTLGTLHALGNLSIAYSQGLPTLDKGTVWTLTNATQKSPYTLNANPDIFDPTPIELKSPNSNLSYGMTIMPLPAMQVWATADQLKTIKDSGFPITDHPEMFTGINAKVISNLWCGFQNPYGLAYIENKRGNNITPATQDFKDLIKLQWDIYSQFTSQRGGSNLAYNRDFPWYDSKQLNTIYQDKNQMKAALFELFFINSQTYSDNQKIFLNGLYGAEVDLLQTYDLYKTSMSVSLNETINGKEAPAKDLFYGWVGDRGEHGLGNTVGKFIGLDPFPKYGIYFPDFIKMANYNSNNGGINGYLTNNWQYWNLIRHLVGSAWNRHYLWPSVYYPGAEIGGDTETTNYIIPSLLRIAGFPVYFVNIEPTPKGAANREWAVGLPPMIVDSLSDTYPDAKIVFGPGYTFGLYNCMDGLKKDGQSAFVFLGDSSIYLLNK